jgi:sugar/nucleoside kinase (ribokinase family)
MIQLIPIPPKKKYPNEAFSFASVISEDVCAQKSKLSFDELALESARVLAKYLRARIDLHTTAFSATISTKQEVIVPAFRVEVLRVTGAGDAWDAGNIIGDANALSDETRLALANAISAYYVSNPEGGSPSQQQLLKFIQNTKI